MKPTRPASWPALPSLVRANLRRHSVPERIDFTMNGEEIALIAVPKDFDLIPN